MIKCFLWSIVVLQGLSVCLIVLAYTNYYDLSYWLYWHTYGYFFGTELGHRIIISVISVWILPVIGLMYAYKKP